MARNKKFELLENCDTSINGNTKYKCGANSDPFDKVKNLKPVFAFDYLCDDSSEYSFVGRRLGSSDYQKLLKNLKLLSSQTYDFMDRHKDKFHFHEVDWSDVDIKESDFNKCVFGKSDKDGDITPYQFKVFEEARLLGFFYQGVFYLVFFDRGHNAYKRK